jgi:UTP--glucose-1-phosphate uridylyltransferase
MKIKKAVITAAARGNRLYPVADTVQKAMLPIIDIDGINKPVIQIIAEEAFSSGIEEVCIICAPGDDKRYIESFKILQSSILSSFKNSSWAEKQSAAISNLLGRISFAVQKESLGYGHAVYQAKEFVNDESFLLLLGDYLYVSNEKGRRCAKQLIDLAVKEDCSVSAVNPTIEHLLSKYGTLTGRALLSNEGVYHIEKIIEKPSVSQAELELQTPGLRAGYYLCLFGMNLFKPYIFDLIGESIKSITDAPILLTPIMQKIAETNKYLAMEIKGTRYDTSRKLGLLQAQIAIGLAGDIKDELMTSIIQLLAEANSRI